ncbi:MAG: hypothetical protein HFE32_01570 [Clostridia bacterium]|jgi:hypothetical protein|nr:hypothetical protein [Clostridia bacterium]MCI9290474.1 hypothetical protein [Clostridia bacterium]
MRELNLTAEGTAQERILAYLQENVSEVLAEKINNGTPIEKDGKQLTSKKTLKGFMKYANDEAKKLSEKGATCACIEDKTVYGWSIHYFEEDSIEGTLYNEDGTGYKPIIKTPPKQNSVVANKPKEQDKQPSLFDLIDAQDEEKINKENNTQQIAEVSEILNDLNPRIQQRKEIPQFYSQYLETQKQYPQDIVINRLGDFYEAFGESAVTLSKELDLTLTGRNIGLDERLPMVGFPYHAAEIYINKIRNNHSVVVIEQEDIKRLTQTVKANDGNTVVMDTGEVLDSNESNPYVEILSRLLENKIKYVR